MLDDNVSVAAVGYNYTYALRISYKYDLNDGSGIIDETKEFTVTTSKQIPTLRFNPYNI